MKPDKRKHSLNCESTVSALACFGLLLGAEAVGNADTISQASVHLSPTFAAPYTEANQILWQNAPLSAPLNVNEGVTKSQMQQNLKLSLASDPTLGNFYQFRETLRGSGKTPVRKWTLTSSGKDTINLELGAHSLSGFSLVGLSGSESSIGIGGQNFGLYTSAPVKTLNRSLASYDAMLGNTNNATLDQSKLTWLQFQPLHSKTANLQLMWASGETDLNPTTTTLQSLRGSLWGLQGNYALPVLANWKFNGQWVKSNVADSNGATAWQAKLSGPIHHPLGIAKLSAVFTDVDPGFQSFAATPIENGIITKTVALEQPLGKGDLTANLGLSLNDIDRDGIENQLLPKHESTFNGTARLRWQVAPSIALTANHTLTSNTDELYPGSAVNVQKHDVQDTQAGVELKVSPALLVNVGAGTKTDQILQQQNALLNSTYDNNSSYLTVGVKNKMFKGTFGVDLQRNFTQDELANAGNNNVVVSLNTQQKLSDWLNVGGKLCLGNSYPSQPTSTILSAPADLTANAQISLHSLGAVQLTYNQWNLQNALDASPNTDTANAYQISYLMGAHNGQSGLGLSVAYSYSAAANPQNATWQVGLTYR